jgi:hypothetical protein
VRRGQGAQFDCSVSSRSGSVCVAQYRASMRCNTAMMSSRIDVRAWQNTVEVPSRIRRATPPSRHPNEDVEQPRLLRRELGLGTHVHGCRAARGARPPPDRAWRAPECRRGQQLRAAESARARETSDPVPRSVRRQAARPAASPARVRPRLAAADHRTILRRGSRPGRAARPVRGTPSTASAGGTPVARSAASTFSAAVSSDTSPKPCNTIANRRRCAAVSGSPSSVITPESGWVSPASIDSSDVLPEPEAPRTASRSRELTVNPMALNTCRPPRRQLKPLAARTVTTIGPGRRRVASSGQLRRVRGLPNAVGTGSARRRFGSAPRRRGAAAGPSSRAVRSAARCG